MLKCRDGGRMPRIPAAAWPATYGSNGDSSVTALSAYRDVNSVGIPDCIASSSAAIYL